MSDDNVVDHAYLHSILSDFPLTNGVQTLNSCNALFRYFQATLHHMKPEIICNMFQCDPENMSQTATPMEHMAQFLLLVLVYRTYVP